MKRKLQEPLARFMKYVDKTPTCWLWTGGKSHKYGRFWTHGTWKEPAHRWAYEHFVGKVPDGLVLDHLCKNKSCVNPRHLEPVTLVENFQRCDLAIRRKTRCINGHEYAVVGYYTHLAHNRRTMIKACRKCISLRDSKRRSVINTGRRKRGDMFRAMGLTAEGKPYKYLAYLERD